MRIERQSEQWPYRREAMLRAADPRHDRVNPAAHGTPRPDTPWESANPEQDVLPMAYPSYKLPINHNQDTQSIPGHQDVKPISLYRGIRIPLDHPANAAISRAVSGPVASGSSDFQLPGTDSPSRALDPHEVGQLLLDHMNNFSDEHDLGRHWSTSPGVADSFAHQLSQFVQSRPQLAVRMRAHWSGVGEDPRRTNTDDGFADMSSEKEITMMHGAPLHLQELQYKHPQTGQWNDALPSPRHVTAAFNPYGDDMDGPNPDWEYDEDEDEEPQDGYIRENNPVRLKSPLYPDGHKSRPFFSDDLDDLGGNRKIYHFNPHDFNPPSDSPARGDAYWPRYRKDPPEGVLPLDLPAMAMPNMPTDRNPIPLYRGINLRLDHPDLQWIRRALHGDSREDGEDHQLTPGAGWSPHFTDRDKTDGYYFGQPSRQPYLDPSMTNRALADPKEEGDSDLFYDHDLRHRMTHTILDHMNEQKGGLGTHWGMGEDNARNFAASGNGFGHSAPTLPVVITHNWMGTGEDPYRRNTEGEWPDEQEITHLHGAKANVSAVHVQHPHHGWVKIFDADDHGETLTHKASR